MKGQLSKLTGLVKS